ncbi:MAG TPA: hypothetical protein G4N99_01275 [Thermoflexia bacterium]|nr:hypothetical protein [Thermoflexia bacterium]
MKKYITIILALLLLLGSQIACDEPPQVPDIKVPTIQVGEMQDKREAIPLEDDEPVAVELAFGAGDLEIEAGASDQLFSGHFRYNVEQWEPEVTYAAHVLTIEQGGADEEWGFPTGNTRNEWELEFSPEIPLDVNLQVGAGKGNLDLTGLQLVKLDLDLGAGDFSVQFGEPNGAEMGDLTLDAGASRLEVVGIGNASPEMIKVQGGVGNIDLDLTGDWSRSADVRVTAGVGALTLRLPDDVGVQVDVEGGLSNVNASGLERDGDTYVNAAFGEAEVELRIEVTTGVGTLHLIEISD